MSVSHFENSVREHVASLTAALLKTDIHDHARMIQLRGQIEGLDMALQKYREASRKDIDGDGL